MNKQFSAAELAFRDEVRAFLRDQLPADISHKVGNDLHLGREDYVRWQRILHARGWAGVNWPLEYGGTGRSRAQINATVAFAELKGEPAPLIMNLPPDQQ